MCSKRNTAASGFAEKNFDEIFLGIHVTTKNNTERVKPIFYDMEHGLTRNATANKIHHLRSVTQSLAWIARQTRFDLACRMSKIHSTLENACV